jgi:glycosyltransferase involved in cell wall biosynthesis
MKAAAAAMPIVTTAVSGADAAVVDGETGYIVPRGDVPAFTERLRQLLADPSLRARMGAAAAVALGARSTPPRTLGARWRSGTSSSRPGHDDAGSRRSEAAPRPGATGERGVS